MKPTKKILLALAFLSLGATLATSGCATTTGLVTGAFTGAVDLPAEVYRHNDDFFQENPIFWTPNVLVLGPIGFAGGPIIGAVKGFALDIEWLIHWLNYAEVFGTYRQPSVWRPYTVRW